MNIKTLVYFDLEATGLKSSGKPRITELSLVAVDASEILNLHKKIEKCTKENNEQDVEQLLPRVMNKLTLCIYPMTTIMPIVSNLTGLDNYNLTDQAKFDCDTAGLINCFLSRLMPPVCLVAHNGDYYDYPLLKAELDKAGVGLPKEILCVDSYVGFKEILPKRNVKRLNEQTIAEQNLIHSELNMVNKFIAAGMFDDEIDDQIMDDVKQVNESTPKRPKRELGNEIAPPIAKKVSGTSTIETLNQENESTPTKFEDKIRAQGNSKQLSCSSYFKTRKKLFNNRSVPSSYSLTNIHKFLLGSNPLQSHGAEADCLSLIRATAAIGEEWLDWVHGNYYVFMDCKPMWGEDRLV